MNNMHLFLNNNNNVITVNGQIEIFIHNNPFASGKLFLSRREEIVIEASLYLLCYVHI